MAFRIGADCKIHPSAVIKVEDGYIGAGSIVNEGARIEGTLVQIGREAYIDRFATIGGGSCFDPQAFLKAGDWFHMGVQSQVNTASGVTVGHEFGCGVETKVFSHGAYLDSYNLGAPVQWAPVTIGDNVWLPNAWVNPGVKIGSNVVVAARSLVNRDIPAGSLAGGSPCKVLRTDYFPRVLSDSEKAELVHSIFEQTCRRFAASNNDARPTFNFDAKAECGGISVAGEKTEFRLKAKTITGSVNAFTLLFKDQLRRNGIRFRFRARGDAWLAWGLSGFEYD